MELVEGDEKLKKYMKIKGLIYLIYIGPGLFFQRIGF